ncbi:MAG: precorrin-6y C5,15-methyltransferase (decarboxylating) subunit CbiE [Prevotella sp.]|nr:precorrin-6y C5,15-methyltransferase (decarboxylating) subunit CbiE [Prevotella sp.]
MKFIVIGITDDPQPWFPPEVQEIIHNGRLFSGGRRHHEIVAPILPDDAKWIDITVPLDDVFKQYQTLASRPSSPTPHSSSPTPHSTFPVPEIIVFASGDPLFFGFANTIRRKMPEAEIRIFPAFNSLQTLAHRLVMPYHDMRIVSLTGRPWHEFDRALIEREPKIGVLTDREHTPAAIAQRMMDYGYTYYNIYIGEHLGNPGEERVSVLTLEATAKQEFSQPNCVILSCKPGSAEASSTPKPFGLPDSSFALLDGREKMITKMPIRLLTLQALDLPSKHVLWDIGACTGSVSIEARLLFPHLHIVAFEVRPECESIIHENARRHGAPGIELHTGDFLSFEFGSVAADSAPSALSSTPKPDAVFIGGHGGRLKEIMEKVLSVLAPGGIIVMNSVTAPKVTRDSRQLWDEACRELGLHQESPLHVQLNDNHPITILRCKR